MSVTDIILIDDNLIFRETLARSLSNLDCDVEHFSHPEEALPTISSKKSEEGNPLIILLDLKLEADSGLRWIKTIRENNSHCKLILLTGYSSISTAVEAIKLGADDYLSKPTTAREILSHIQKQDTQHHTTIEARPMSVERLEWEHIQKVLQDNDGNISASARALGMHRRTLQRKLLKKPMPK